MIVVLLIMLLIFKIIVNPVRKKLDERDRIYTSTIAESEQGNNSNAYRSLTRLMAKDMKDSLGSPESYRNFSYPPNSKLFRVGKKRRSQMPDENEVKADTPRRGDIVSGDGENEESSTENHSSNVQDTASCKPSTEPKAHEQEVGNSTNHQETISEPGYQNLENDGSIVTISSNRLSTIPSEDPTSEPCESSKINDIVEIEKTDSQPPVLPFESPKKRSLCCNDNGISFTFPTTAKNPGTITFDTNPNLPSTKRQKIDSGTRTGDCSTPMPPSHNVDIALICEVLAEQFTSTVVYRWIRQLFCFSTQRSQKSVSISSRTELLDEDRESPLSHNRRAEPNSRMRIKRRPKRKPAMGTKDDPSTDSVRNKNIKVEECHDEPISNIDGVVDIRRASQCKPEELMMSGALPPGETSGPNHHIESISRELVRDREPMTLTQFPSVSSDPEHTSPTGTVRRLRAKAQSPPQLDEESENDYMLYSSTYLPDQTPGFATSCYANTMSPHSSLKEVQKASGSQSRGASSVPLKREKKVKKQRPKAEDIQFEGPSQKR